MMMFGLNRLFQGLRSSNPALTAFGLALAIVGFARNRRRPGTTLLYSKQLKPGEELRFRLSD